MKIVHIITGLGNGGAEHTLFKICKYDKLNQHIVISFKGKGKYFSLLKGLGIKVYCLNANFFSIQKFFFLIKQLRFINPDIVQTWLIHADFVGGIAARLAGIKKIIWNIRYSNFELGKAKLATVIIIKILSKLSFFIPQFIIINSKRAKKIFEKDYDKKKLKLISNGIDLSILKPSKIEKINFKKKNKVKKQIPLIGNVATYDPKKDHLNLIKALSFIRSENINFFCTLVGTNINKNNIELNSNIKKLGLTGYVKLLGQNDKIKHVMNGLDIYVQSSSYGEGFPNVVAEAMACGTPCVVTDVGDAGFIVGKNGWIVSPKDPTKLANAIKKAISEIGSDGWNKKRNKARSRIKKNFNIDKMIRLYNELWNRVYKSNQ